MVVFAILVGMVTETVESAVHHADGETSRVVVSDHILVCDWGAHVAQIIKDVNNVSSNVKVVVLAPEDKKGAMIEEIRSTLPDAQRKNVRIFYRPGAPIVAQDLERVAAARARKIILVNPRGADQVDGDRLILSRALALRQNLPSFQGDIVAELSNVRDEGILRSILEKSHARSVETVNTEQLLFRFMAQAIRQPGLADVVALLMGDNPSSVFHVSSAKDAAPQLVGTSFADLRPTSVPGSILCGFVNNSNVVYIENGNNYTGEGATVQASTKFLLLGASKSMRNVNMTMKASSFDISPSTSSMLRAYIKQNHKERQKAEHFLVLGWRKEMEYMLQELDGILPHGSKMTIVDEDVPDRLSANLSKLKLSWIRKRADRYGNIEELINNGSKPFDHVVVLGTAMGDGEKEESATGRGADAKTLATLVYVNDLIGKQNADLRSRDKEVKQTMVTVEFVTEGVADIAKDQSNVANTIMPQNLGAKIAAQTVRDNRLNSVWKELLSQAGREVYLRPVAAYSNISGERASFATVADKLAKTDDEIVIGYIPRYVASVKINPQDGERFNTRVWDENDMLIVLSKD